MEQTKEMKDHESLKEKIKMCYCRIAEQKMKLTDRIAFGHNGKHYVLMRTE